MDAPKRINLQGLIRLDQVEDVLNRLMDRIDSQDVLIRQLYQQCETFQSRENAAQQAQILQDTCVHLQKQVDSVRICALAPVDEGKT